MARKYRTYKGRKVVPHRGDFGRYYTVRFRYGNEIFDTFAEACAYIDYHDNWAKP